MAVRPRPVAIAEPGSVWRRAAGRCRLGRMAQRVFDDDRVRAAMRSFLDAADAMDEMSRVGGEARNLLDIAESKAMAAMTLRKELEQAGWTAPAKDSASA